MERLRAAHWSVITVVDTEQADLEALVDAMDRVVLVANPMDVPDVASMLKAMPPHRELVVMEPGSGGQ